MVGQNSYQTKIQVEHIGSAPENKSVNVFHAADCYLQDSDDGYGSHNPSTGAITCHAPDPESTVQPSPTARIEEFVPLTANSNYLYSNYDDVWAHVGTQLAFPDEVRQGSVEIDNSIGLSWTFPEGSGTASLLTNFSAIGLVSLPAALTIVPSSIEVGEVTTVTATINNPNVTPQSLTQVQFVLPSAVAFVPGSHNTATAPSVSGNTVTFTGPFAVDASGNGVFSFEVRGISESDSATIAVTGATESGAPVLGASATVTVTDSGEWTIVDPVAPTVVQATCPVPGSPTAPKVTLPTTEGVEYSLTGTVAAGETVTVTATAQEGFRFGDTTGWTRQEDRATITMQIVLDTISCEATPPALGVPETGSNGPLSPLTIPVALLVTVAGSFGLRRWALTR